MSRKVIILAALLAFPTIAFAWDGIDSETGASVDIGKGNLVRRGETIEIYDGKSGTYKDVEVNSIDRNGGSVDVEIYDSETGETRVLEMDQ